MADDGGLAVVRIKPLGAGGGGVEHSAGAATVPGVAAFTSDGAGRAGVRANGKDYTYPRHVLTPADGQEQLYERFMAPRVDAFVAGTAVNIMAYGQTGSGKTHTMFGLPGIMARAGAGEFGTAVCPDYGLCPRGMLDVVARVAAMRAAAADGTIYELTCSAVELSMCGGNVDLFQKQTVRAAKKSLWDSSVAGVAIDRTVKPPGLYGMDERSVDGVGDLLPVFACIARRNTATTGLNDTSSRSHCFVWLTLYAVAPGARTVSIAKFQFADLAGSESIADAHNDGARGMGAMEAVKEGNTAVLEGMLTNAALSCLRMRVGELAAAARKGKSARELVEQSFKTQCEPDLLPLLADTLTGAALTLCVVCVSSAPQNAKEGAVSLDFGKAFRGLAVRPVAVRPVPLKALEAKAARLTAASAKGAGGSSTDDKYAVLRRAMGRQGAGLARILQRIAAATAAPQA
jgi:hypothetical protein